MKHTRTLLTALLLAPLVALLAAEPSKPNVVFILADDLGWADTTLYGQTKFYRTPNLERLAKRGMTFTRAYSASPLCSPTRSAIMTGLCPARTGITTPNCHEAAVVLQATQGTKAPPAEKAIAPRPPTRLKTEYRTLAEALKDAGYVTGHFGKWHLGREPYSPLQQGFDVDVPHWPGPGPAGGYVAPWKFHDFDPDTPGQHIEDRMAKEAVAFLEKSKDQPFYLNYWMFSVHAPFDAKPALIEKHRARVDPADAQRSPTYAAMVESMDDAVGALLDALDRLGIATNTIIIFTSDNGGNMYNEVDGTTPTSNRPLRGGKATLFEGGTRVPCIIAWPGLTRAGSRSDAVIQSEDYYPTLLAGLGLQPAAEQRFDGISIVPALRGSELTRDAVFQYFPHDPRVPDWLPPAVSVHSGDWKLIRIFHGGENGAHRHLLFNLRDDLGETNNLAAAQPARVKELDARIERFLVETKAVVPVPNPAFDPAQYRPELEGKQHQPKPAKQRAARKPDAGGKLAEKPSVLFIAIDDLNDWVGCLGGHPQARTPNIDRLAARGTLFANAHCQAPLCNPSRSSLLTGRRPSSTGIYGLAPGIRDVTATREAVTLPQHFAAQGYETASFGKIHHEGSIPPRLQKDEFGTWGPAPGMPLPERKLVETPSPMRAVDWGVFPEDDRMQADWKIADAAIAHLRALPADRPFFLACGFRLPHVPCFASQKWFDLFPAEPEIALPAVLEKDRDDTPPFSWFLHWKLPEPRRSWLEQAGQWRPLVRAYLASTAFMDSQVGRLLDALDASGRGSNTVVVLWSDNGWHLGEKGITGKNSLWQESTRVPLIFAGPGVAGGATCRQPAELLDLYPTLIELCGLPARAGLEGHSLLAQLRDAKSPRTWPAITTHNAGNHSVCSERWRYIRYADASEELYDHLRDPHEWTNRAADAACAEVIREHARWLPANDAPPAPGSAQRTLERRGNAWLWEGKPIDPLERED